MTTANAQFQKDIREFLSKSMTTGDLSTGGELNADQSSGLVDYIFDITSVKDSVRQEKFRNKEWELNKVGLGKRVIVAKEEAQDPQVRRRARFSKITLQPKGLTVPLCYSDEFLAQNLQGRSIEDRIFELMARVANNEIETLGFTGNTLGYAATADELDLDAPAGQYRKDAAFAISDGWLKLAEAGNVVDALGAPISPALFMKARRALPVKFRKQMDMMRYMLPDDLESAYVETISARADNAGVGALNNGDAKSFGWQRQSLLTVPIRARKVEHIQLNGVAVTALLEKNISDVVVTVENLGLVFETPYVDPDDYTVDLVAGTITRDAGGAIGDGEVVKVTYLAPPAMLLTDKRNLIMGIGLDLKVLTDVDIYADVRQWAMHMRIAFQIEEPEACVLVKNIADPNVPSP